MKFIAVQGCTINIAPAPGSTGVWNNAPPTQVTPASLKCIAGTGILKDLTQFLSAVGSITNPPMMATVADLVPVPIVFSTTATKCKADGTLVLREGDYVDVTYNPMTPPPPYLPNPSTPIPTVMRVTIQSAGQTKVKGS